ncbi:hypothetical protein VII00023_15538, partial [Vibrio ichthyoenteri ATCC 700023]
SKSRVLEGQIATKAKLWLMKGSHQKKHLQNVTNRPRK